MKITSKTEVVNANDYKIYGLISNCNNFGKFLPEQIHDWESTEDYCKFTVPNISTLTVSVIEKIEYSKVTFSAQNDKNIPIKIVIYIEGKGSTSTIESEIDIEIPILLSSMVKTPLQNLVDIIISKIKQAAEKY